jgi:hypothetical protein
MLADRVRMGIGMGDVFGEPYLYNNGKFSEYWQDFSKGTLSVFNVSKNSDHIYVLREGSTFNEGGITTIDPIDFTGVNTVYVTIKLNHLSGGSIPDLGGVIMSVGEKTQSYSGGQGYKIYSVYENPDLIQYGVTTTLPFDVSTINSISDLRITLASFGTPQTLKLEAYIYEIWLE